MKATVEIPDQELEDVMRFTGARSGDEAILQAILEFNRRHRMASLARHAGTSDTMVTNEELEAVGDEADR